MGRTRQPEWGEKGSITKVFPSTPEVMPLTTEPSIWANKRSILKPVGKKSQHWLLQLHLKYPEQSSSPCRRKEKDLEKREGSVLGYPHARVLEPSNSGK